MRPTLAARFAAAAEGLVGAPFRLHGRDPATGLDCVGLVAEALRRSGRMPLSPAGYRLRMLDVTPLLHFAAANGLASARPPVAAGDVILVHIAGVQPHLLVAAEGGGLVHAHAGLGRVVRQPGPSPWPAAACWRLDTKG